MVWPGAKTPAETNMESLFVGSGLPTPPESGASHGIGPRSDRRVDGSWGGGLQLGEQHTLHRARDVSVLFNDQRGALVAQLSRRTLEAAGRNGTACGRDSPDSGGVQKRGPLDVSLRHFYSANL